MKKILSVLLAVCVLATFAIFAVGSSDDESNSPNEVETTENIVDNETSSTTETTTEEKTEKDTTEKISNKDNNAIRPEFKKAMDSYEEFMNEYVDFMKKYSKSNGTDMSLLADYAKFMSEYSDFVKDFEKWENEDMNAAETAYYLDVQSRVTKKLAEVTY